jgi:hypothetical protein
MNSSSPDIRLTPIPNPMVVLDHSPFVSSSDITQPIRYSLSSISPLVNYNTVQPNHENSKQPHREAKA